MLLYLSLLISYLRNRLFGNEWLVGADCSMRWSSQTEVDNFIVSFAPEPDRHAKFDDYGWAVDEPFLYMKNLRDLILFLHDCKRMGHQVIKTELAFAVVAE